ncbi:MAG: 3-demethylubiquinone-9 3-O-methyltransferase [Candidatus Amesbacteria bacterium GW2011_GWA2_47_11b]|uniref:3-demethylubiquinone-9 3-O-methyltransferase n=3 Tax=Candidatus Amesiibacteriota TaxID=1752730 RepID=A0A0G1VJV7_9BACT|nr:MAG: 3-demethylubiquinone-9 3-O-methyltransferase [Candidatus Curtissbacteria bacterium GW2011_GWB1_40_28]KKU29424.1 MAG: 3-demethylubiquinone-9 3-O-methyltransferase [Microgenomates group bacterium GW2011_GWC1_46_20]KKU58526.1 MAG: 3-demethylubiquinone-9 3-O-methyltransferase [Candidatus Amesbacteria bacterium GW2011_GWA2_47_11b]KKU70365.1 MAG: 3-demethylubiquinone-9 3-O-methyltransferase [Candidatus Amesbacteria bacterium GW2011_GWA1_47_20]KKU83654.1 MAG: 3-demethylubiquinone-9 3-O-methylt
MPKFPIYPNIGKEKFKSWNENMFIKYNNERVYSHPNPIIRFVERVRVSQILHHLSPLKDSDKILAAGCGEGYIEKYFNNGEITLMDISNEAIRRARLALGRKTNFSFINGDLEKIPIPDAFFDKVECSEVIEHVIDPKKMLRELRRVLKPKGLLVITFPNEPLINLLKRILIKFYLFSHFFPNIPNDMTEEWHLRAYNLKRFKEDLCEGWLIKKIRGIPFDILPIRYLVVCTKQ